MTESATTPQVEHLAGGNRLAGQTRTAAPPASPKHRGSSPPRDRPHVTTVSVFGAQERYEAVKLIDEALGLVVVEL